jgi:DNA polymerase-3 subunit beta
MKFIASRAKLLPRLQEVLGVVPTRTTLPILSNLILETGEGKIKIAATDLDIAIITYTQANVSKKGSLSVPAKMVTDLVREAPEGDITFTATDNRLEIKLGSGQYKIGGIAAEEYPKLPDVNLNRQVKVESAELVKMIRKTSFAISNDETRPALNGAYWRANENEMLMVATDGHRLTKYSGRIKKFAGLSGEVIVPLKALNLITRLVGEENGEIGVIFGDKNIIVNLGETIISSRLIEGPYPNFEAVIPKDNDKHMIVDKDILSSTLKRVSLLSSNLTHQVKFGLKKDKIELSAANSDVGGEAKETIPSEYAGEEMDIGYNANYLQDVLRQMDGSLVNFSFSSAVSAGMVVPKEKKEGEEYLCLVMPLRLAD